MKYSFLDSEEDDNDDDNDDDDDEMMNVSNNVKDADVSILYTNTFSSIPDLNVEAFLKFFLSLSLLWLSLLWLLGDFTVNKA